MLAGVIAAVMSNLAAKSMAIASLFVRNVYRLVWPEATEERGVLVARWTIVAVLALGLLAATTMTQMERIVRLIITVNVPFGAAILMMFFWRRLTVKAVWITLGLCVLVNITLPLTMDYIPAARSHPALVKMSVDTQGRPAAVYFDQVLRSDPTNPASPLVGKGRFNMEAYLFGKMGVDVVAMSPNGRLSVQYFWDAFFPFAMLILFSLVTRDRDQARIDFFYGKMKTPVGATPELELAAIEETRRNPGRFDKTKLFGSGSSWEFTVWDKTDSVGFIACCAVSGGMILLFWALLKLVAGA
jgi:hypothetical protein